MLSRPCGSEVDTGGAVGQGQQGADQYVWDLLIDLKGVGMGYSRFTSERGH